MTGRRRVTVAAGGVVDEQVPDLLLAGSGGRLTLLAGLDGVAQLPGEGLQPPVDFLPPPGGWRVALLTFPPPGAPRPAAGEGIVLADLAEQMRRGGGTGMHTTASVDVVLILTGRITLELADGTEIALATGDSVLQLGAPHRWVNHGTDPVTMALFMAGAHHTDA